MQSLYNFLARLFLDICILRILYARNYQILILDKFPDRWSWVGRKVLWDYFGECAGDEKSSTRDEGANNLREYRVDVFDPMGFRRWRYTSNENFFKADVSIKHISYVVIQTWKLWVRSLVAIISARSSLVPVSMTRSKSGVHCWNSRCQFEA